MYYNEEYDSNSDEYQIDNDANIFDVATKYMLKLLSSSGIPTMHQQSKLTQQSEMRCSTTIMRVYVIEPHFKRALDIISQLSYVHIEI